jgi:hypothetical protein
MNNFQKLNNCTNRPLSQIFRSYVSVLFVYRPSKQTCSMPWIVLWTADIIKW